MGDDGKDTKTKDEPNPFLDLLDPIKNQRLIQIFDFAIVGILFCVACCWIIGIGNIHLYILAFLACGLGGSVHFVLSHVKASLAKEADAKKAQ